MRMFKKDIIAEVAKKTGLSIPTAQTYVETVFMSISDALKKGSEVQITDFGTFKIKENAKRKYILNGNKVVAPKHKTVKFSCGAGLKAKVNKKKKK